MPVVRLSDETYERLKALATPFRGSELGTPEKVIEHLLDAHEPARDEEAEERLEQIRAAVETRKRETSA